MSIKNAAAIKSVLKSNNHQRSLELHFTLLYSVCAVVCVVCFITINNKNIGSNQIICYCICIILSCKICRT